MYDGVTAANIPVNAQMVGGYDDGAYRWSQADWARFPNAVQVHITVLANPASPVYDCEPGNGTPANAVPFAQGVLARGGIPTIYCGQNTWWGQIQSLINAAGLGGKVNYWVANYDGVQTIPPGAVAKQYADPGPYDLSVVSDYWPGIDTVPPPAPPDPPEVTTVKQVVIWDATRVLLHFLYLVPTGATSALYYRNKNAAGDLSTPYTVGDALDDNAGLSAELQPDGQIDAFCRASPTTPTTGRHFWTLNLTQWSWEAI